MQMKLRKAFYKNNQGLPANGVICRAPRMKLNLCST